MKKMEVWFDKYHSQILTLELLDYGHCEAMKSYRMADLTVYAHYMRFLESIAKNNHIGPSFEEYISWTVRFVGWSYGAITELHSCWDSSYKYITLPMNKYYIKTRRFPRKKK